MAPYPSIILEISGRFARPLLSMLPSHFSREFVLNLTNLPIFIWGMELAAAHFLIVLSATPKNCAACEESKSHAGGDIGLF